MKKIPIEAHLKGKNAKEHLQKALHHFTQKEVNMGVKDEKEHTSSPVVAGAIALAHLMNEPKYYEKMKKAHLEATDVFDFNFHDILEGEDDPIGGQAPPIEKEVKAAAGIANTVKAKPKKLTRTIDALQKTLGTKSTVAAPKAEPVKVPTSFEQKPKVTKARIDPGLFKSDYYTQQTAHALKQRDKYPGVPAVFLPQPGGKPRTGNIVSKGTQLRTNGERVSGEGGGHPFETPAPDIEVTPNKGSAEAFNNKHMLADLSKKMKAHWKTDAK